MCLLCLLQYDFFYCFGDELNLLFPAMLKIKSHAQSAPSMIFPSIDAFHFFRFSFRVILLLLHVVDDAPLSPTFVQTLRLNPSKKADTHCGGSIDPPSSGEIQNNESNSSRGGNSSGGSGGGDNSCCRSSISLFFFFATKEEHASSKIHTE